MILPKAEKPRYERKIPHLSADVEAKTKDGIYQIDLPTLQPSTLKIDGVEKTDTIQLRCNSLYLRSGEHIHCCNSTVKSIVGNGTGDQTEIIECAKCRTSYLIRQRYINGKLELKMSVWDTSRNIKNCSFHQHDKQGNYLVKFNTQSKT